VGEDPVEQRAKVGRFPTVALPGRTRPGVREKDRELQLPLGRIQVDKQVVHLVDHLADPGVRAIDLVHGQDDGELPLQRLLENEARLRERPLGGVDEEQGPVDHLERPLHLAAEVGVPRGVHDVDLHASVG